MNRRTLLKSLLAIPFIGNIFAGKAVANASLGFDCFFDRDMTFCQRQITEYGIDWRVAYSDGSTFHGINGICQSYVINLINAPSDEQSRGRMGRIQSFMAQQAERMCAQQP